MKPDDITEQENSEAIRELRRNVIDAPAGTANVLRYALAAQNALRDQRIHAELLAEIKTLRQALWDAGTIIGMDTDGDTTPDHRVNLVESILYEMRAARAAYDEALAPEDATRVATEAARAERERIAEAVYRYLDRVTDNDDFMSTWTKSSDPALEYHEGFARAVRDFIREEGDAPDPEPCPSCGGKGFTLKPWMRGRRDFIGDCRSCGGTGHTPTKEKP